MIDGCKRVFELEGADAGLGLRPKNIGARVKLVEDPQLLTGQGAFTADRIVPGAPLGPVQARPGSRRRLIGPHPEHASRRLDLVPSGLPRDEGARERSVEVVDRRRQR
jgi:hypothetical protein